MITLKLLALILLVVLGALLGNYFRTGRAW
jgi:hypothetical protein